MMKTKWILFYVLILCSVTAIAADPFKDVVGDLESALPWTRKASKGELRSLIKSTSGADTLTAKVLLAGYLLAGDTTNLTKDEAAEPFELCRSIAQSAPGSWQAQLARYYLVIEPGYSGDYANQAGLARRALSEIDFALFKKTNDKCYRSILKTFGCSKRNGIKEALTLVLANALCETDQLEEAERVQAQLSEEKYKKAIGSRVDLGKAMRDKRKQKGVVGSKKSSGRESIDSGSVFRGDKDL
jgi:hypothetical protein